MAKADNRIIGAVWVRIMYDYDGLLNLLIPHIGNCAADHHGHIDDETPSFAISLYRDYRNHGIGTALMQNMLETLRKNGYRQTSLAVQKANYAVKMYKNVGFEMLGVVMHFRCWVFKEPDGWGVVSKNCKADKENAD